MRIGIAHHLGWAIAVTATADHRVADRRRIELIEPGLPAAPVHHEGGTHALHRSGEPLDDAELAELVAAVRASARRATSAALDDLASGLADPVRSVSVRDWPPGFPSHTGSQRRAPYESRADSVMYCQVLAEVAAAHGWDVHRYDHRTVEAEARRRLADRADDVLLGPRAALGPPWTSDHRMALAATVVVGS